MKNALVILVCACALAPTGARSAELVLDSLVARVTVVPEVRSDFAVEVRAGSGTLPPVIVTQKDGRARLTSGVAVGACAQSGNRMQVGLSDGSRAEMSEAPEIIIHAPRTFTVSGTESGLIGRIGPTSELDIRQGGCAFWDAADVAGTLRAEMSGGARLTVGAAGSALLDASGGGAVATGAVADLVAAASGGGAIRVESVGGAVEASASGGGSVAIKGGRATSLRAQASGGGWVEHHGDAAALRAEASGGGRIMVSRVGDVISRSVSGGGQVIVGN